MGWPKTSRPKERYYLFAGMGGSASRRKRAIFLVWSVVIGLLTAGILTFLLFYFNRLRVG